MDHEWTEFALRSFFEAYPPEDSIYDALYGDYW
jgi:hypothetical protein